MKKNNEKKAPKLSKQENCEHEWKEKEDCFVCEICGKEIPLDGSEGFIE